MVISIDELERVAALGWCAPEQDRIGDWLLRAAGGFTGRANSALVVGDPGLPLATAIGIVSRWYADRGLPPMIAIPYPAGNPRASQLDRALAERGWTLRAGAATVMAASAATIVGASAATAAQVGAAAATASAGTAAAATAGAGTTATAMAPESTRTVELHSEPDPAWLARYHYRGQQLPAIALALLTSAPWQAFASVRAGAQVIAIGRVAVASAWAGITAVEVDPLHRRQGLATVVTGALATAAASRGAHSLYLQVEDANAAARALYGRIGFADHHGYHYRVAPGGLA